MTGETAALYWIIESARDHAKHGRHAAALDELGRALRLSPRSAPVWLEIGQVLAHQGVHDEAVEAYDHAIDLEPRFAEAHFQRGLVLAQLGRAEEAKAALKRSAELSPEFQRAIDEIVPGTLANP